MINTFRALVSLLGVLVLSATLHDAWIKSFKMSHQANNNTLDHSLIKILHCFSALKNGREILSTRASSSDLSCLHGIRFLSATWIILYHSNYHIDYSAAYNSFGPNREVFLNKLHELVFWLYYKKYHNHIRTVCSICTSGAFKHLQEEVWPLTPFSRWVDCSLVIPCSKN